MIDLSDQHWRRLAAQGAFVRVVAGVVVAALAVGGCGRKGALDPPPAAGHAEPVVASPDGAVQLQRQFGEAPAVGPDGKPLPPGQRPPRQPFILDFLID